LLRDVDDSVVQGDVVLRRTPRQRPVAMAEGLGRSRLGITVGFEAVVFQVDVSMPA